MKKIKEVLSTFGDRIGINGLCFDDASTCALSFDDIMVNLEYIDDMNVLYAHSIIVDVPEDIDKRLAIMQNIMERNFAFSGTNGGIFGIRQQNSLIYTNKIGTERLELVEFEQFLERHVNLVEDTRTAIKELSDTSSDDILSMDIINSALRI